MLLKFQQLNVKHIKINLKLKSAVWSIICLFKIHILNSEEIHDALQQHTEICLKITQQSLFNKQWTAQQQMKNKIKEKRNKRAEVKEMMQSKYL